MDDPNRPRKEFEDTIFELGKFQMHTENILEELEEIHKGKVMTSSRYNTQILS